MKTTGVAQTGTRMQYTPPYRRVVGALSVMWLDTDVDLESVCVFCIHRHKASDMKIIMHVTETHTLPSKQQISTNQYCMERDTKRTSVGRRFKFRTPIIQSGLGVVCIDLVSSFTSAEKQYKLR